MHVMTVGALGDSITKAFNAHNRSDNPDYSWATGMAADGKVLSHAQRLVKAFPGLSIEVVNAAVSGSKAADLATQLPELLLRRPDYVTILIGANDLMEWLFRGEVGILLQHFKNQVQTAVTALIAGNANIMIVLSGIPNQAHALELATTHRGSGALPAEMAFLSQIPAAFAAQLAEAYKVRLQQVNAVLKEIAAAAAANVRFVDRAPLVRFGLEHLSPHDRYHPSVAGQQLLADVTWEQGWFP